MVNVPMEPFLPVLDPQDTKCFGAKAILTSKQRHVRKKLFSIVQKYWVGFCFPVPHRFSPHTHKVSHKHLDNWIG